LRKGFELAELTREHVAAIKAGNRFGRAFAFHFAPPHAMKKVGREEFHGNSVAVTPAAPADPIEFKKLLKNSVGDEVGHSGIDLRALAVIRPTEVKAVHAPSVLALSVAMPPSQAFNPFAWIDFLLMSKKDLTRAPSALRGTMAYKIIKMPATQLKKVVAEAQRRPPGYGRDFALHAGITEWFANALIKHWKKRAGR